MALKNVRAHESSGDASPAFEAAEHAFDEISLLAGLSGDGFLRLTPLGI